MASVAEIPCPNCEKTLKVPAAVFGKRIKWNFTKFLIDRQGRPAKRYAPVTKPDAMEGEIRRLLGV